MPKADSTDTTAMSATLHGSRVDSFSSMLPFPPDRATTAPMEFVAVLWRRETFVPFEEFPTLARLRQEAADEIERLLAFLDVTETENDLEPSLRFNPHGCNDLEGDDSDFEDGHDSEPWLGATEATNNSLSWRGESSDDREVEDEHDEPILGSIENHPIGYYSAQWVSQDRWASGNTDDREGDDGCDDREEENEYGGDVNDEPHDEDTDGEPSLGWTEDGQHGKQSFNVDAELAAELTDAERQAARDRKKVGGTGIANTKIDPQWYGPAVRLPSGEVLRR